MSTKSLIDQLDKVISHPETPYYVNSKHQLSPRELAAYSPGATPEYKTLVRDFLETINHDLKDTTGNYNKGTVEVLKRKGFRLAQTQDNQCDLIYPGNALRISLN